MSERHGSVPGGTAAGPEDEGERGAGGARQDAGLPGFAPSAGNLLRAARENPVNAALLARLPALGLPEGFLCAGAVFQAVWNRLSGRPVAAGVRDYDVFYFDEDLSWEAEDAVIRRVDAATADLRDRWGAVVEVRNQARVHLWYRDRFGGDYPQLRRATDGIDRYLVRCTCVGIALADGAPYAPDGFDDLWDGVLRPNPLLLDPALFRRKAESYCARWPWLRVAEDAEAPPGPAD